MCLGPLEWASQYFLAPCKHRCYPCVGRAIVVHASFSQAVGQVCLTLAPTVASLFLTPFRAHWRSFFLFLLIFLRVSCPAGLLPWMVRDGSAGRGVGVARGTSRMMLPSHPSCSCRPWGAGPPRDCAPGYPWFLVPGSWFLVTGVPSIACLCVFSLAQRQLPRSHHHASPLPLFPCPRFNSTKWDTAKTRRFFTVFLFLVVNFLTLAAIPLFVLVLVPVSLPFPLSLRGSACGPETPTYASDNLFPLLEHFFHSRHIYFFFFCLFCLSWLFFP